MADGSSAEQATEAPRGARDVYGVNARSSAALRWVRGWVKELAPWARVLHTVAGAAEVLCGVVKDGCKRLEQFAVGLDTERS